MGETTDTIFAKASGAGAAAIAVLRVSGPRTAAMLRRLTGSLPAPRIAALRGLRDPSGGETLDRALVLWFPAPRSYTGEDCAELHLHGGPAVVSAVSEALLGLGCRPAERGEFTRRAFLHGKLDLTQAEAIADLIAAETQAQRRQALRQAEGALATLYRGWTDRAMRIMAHQEAAIEFEMDDLPSTLSDQAREAAEALLAEIARHLADGSRGERLRDGVGIAIIGAPNAGKSSLLNALLGREAAIVSARPGTTRDIVEGWIELGGVPAAIADTAGLRETEDEVEAEGVRRARSRGTAADILLAVFAADAAPDAATLAAVAARPDAVVVASKCDLARPLETICGLPVHATSARTGDGVEALKAALAAMLSSASIAEDPPLTRARHRAALTEAAARLEEALAAGLPELAAEGYRGAVSALGRLTGRVGVEQILDVVFADFCIGK